MRLCQNGHKQPATAEKFCIYCGVELTESTQSVRPQKPAAAQSGAGVKQAKPQVAKPNPNQQTRQPNRPAPQQLQGKQPQYAQPYQPVTCNTCGGYGQRLNPKTIICEECNWLRPLVVGYQLDTKSFEWAADGKAMAVLRSMTPLNMAAKAVSEKVGRRWIESTFNGVLLGPKQMPDIYGQAVRAARLLGMSHMPDVYLSGERPWDCLTFGTDKDSFVVIGSAVASSFRGPDMLFLIAREIGHCRAGHALWKSVIRFFLGEQGPAKGFMAGGILNAIFSPSVLIGGAVEMPLLAWARQAEITADRAGMLAVGDEEVARRVLLSWTLKSPQIYRQINIEAWLEQQGEVDDSYSQLSELTTTSTPYITPRLRLLAEYVGSGELKYWRKLIIDAINRGKAAAQPKAAPPPAENFIRIKCASCQTPMRIPQDVLAGKDELPIKCPNAKCGKITRLKKRAKATETSAAPRTATVSNKKRATAPKAKTKAKAKAKLKRTEEDLNVVD